MKLRRLGRIVIAWGVPLVLGLSFAAEPEAATLPTVADKAAGLERHAGLLDVYVDAIQGRILLALPAAGADGEIGRYLYAEGLASGLGSNPVGLDRGQLGPAKLVVLREVGGRVLVEQVNLAYRANSDNPAERRAVRDSFARSVLWAGKIVARDADGAALVDLTSFLVRDAHDVVARLKSAGQGTYRLDPERSVVDTAATLTFPDNVEFEAVLTFAGSEPGRQVRQVTPTPESITLVQHHSLIRLPDDGYRPRRFDPRAPSFAIEFADYAVPLDRPIEQRWIVRHRLQKIHPERERSEVKEPIVYYVDPGAPEPVRSALIEGAGWWADAFDAAGFVDAFRVEPLPEGAHPLDVRYNMIQWVHRSTRGWSYGGGLRDPRTGEMIKGHVSLGSLRVRQDRLLFEGLLGVAKTGSGAPDDPAELALARIRQLAAHEVGHTLGFTHNFAASTYGRASVMDYPAPLLRVGDDGELDVSRAYGVGMGPWDVYGVRYAYSEFPPGADEEAELRAIVEDGLRRGLRFLSDQDARPAGAAQPLANLWDNGADPVEELAEVMKVRAYGLERFGEGNIAEGRPLAELQEVLAPLYFHHRYQVQAVGKMIGGLDYAYAVRGDGQSLVRPLAAARQRAALDALLDLLEPAVLDLPERVLATIQPRPFGYGGNRELFEGHAAPGFDPIAAASAAADLVVAEILQPERCARLVDFARRDPAQPGLGAVLAALIDRTFETRAGEPARLGALRGTTRVAVTDRLMRLAAGAPSAAVRAEADGALRALRERLRSAGDGDATTAFLAHEIGRFVDRPNDDRGRPLAADEAPPGSPIGSAARSLGGVPDPLPGCGFGQAGSALRPDAPRR
jgi:hypothetical protein